MEIKTRLLKYVTYEFALIGESQGNSTFFMFED